MIYPCLTCETRLTHYAHLFPRFLLDYDDDFEASGSTSESDTEKEGNRCLAEQSFKSECQL